MHRAAPGFVNIPGMRYGLFSISLILALVFGGSVAAADYQLRDLDGKLHRVSDYRGKFLVINFWATWCDPCIEEMPELERFYRNNRGRAAVWGVTFENRNRQKIIEFVENLGVTYPILGYGQDPETGYGRVTVLPTTFIIDPDGLFYHRFEGPIKTRQIVEIIDAYR